MVGHSPMNNMRPTGSPEWVTLGLFPISIAYRCHPMCRNAMGGFVYSSGCKNTHECAGRCLFVCV